MSAIDEATLARRAHLSAMAKEALKDAPEMVHFEHKLTGQFILTDNPERMAVLRADDDWRETRSDTAS